MHTDMQQHDLLGYSTDQKLLLLVELKARIQTGATSLAAQWLRQTAREQPQAYGLFVTSQWMLLRLPADKRLSSPRVVGFWLDALLEQLQESPSWKEADYVVETVSSLDSAIDTKRVPIQKLGSAALSQIVMSWLSFCILTPPDDLMQQPANAWLVESGLHEALYQGSILDSWSTSAGYALVR